VSSDEQTFLARDMPGLDKFSKYQFSPTDAQGQWNGEWARLKRRSAAR
jgi:hypothetical protein